MIIFKIFCPNNSLSPFLQNIKNQKKTSILSEQSISLKTLITRYTCLTVKYTGILFSLKTGVAGHSLQSSLSGAVNYILQVVHSAIM